MSEIVIICLVLLVVVLIIRKRRSSTEFCRYGDAVPLEKLPNEYTTLDDVILPTRYGTIHIDRIVVSPYGIFVVEIKNLKGWIFGHENSEKWTQSLLGKKYIWGWSSKQYKFNNPVRQNRRQAEALNNILATVGNFKIIPIVAFSDDATLKTTMSGHIVVYLSGLHAAIKGFCERCISSEDIPMIVDGIKASNAYSDEIRVRNIAKSKELETQTMQAISDRICPKCGWKLVEKNGKYGSFLGCSNYPRCRFTCKLD